MICKYCNTVFDTSRVRPGERVRCPGCGQSYLRKAAPSVPSVPEKPAYEPKPQAASKRKAAREKPSVGLIVVLIVFIVLLLTVIAGILTYVFAPDTFQRITSGKLEKKQAESINDPYVTVSSRAVRYNDDGSERDASVTAFAYEPNGLVRFATVDGEQTFISYEYDGNGYPSKITIWQPGYDDSCEISVKTEHKADGITRVTMTNEDEFGFMWDLGFMFAYFSLYRNADLTDGTDLIQIRDGEVVFSRLHEQGTLHTTEVQKNRDGSRTVVEVYENTDSASYSKMIAQYDANGRLRKTKQQTGEASAVVTLQYFREETEDTEGFLENGIVVDVQGDSTLIAEDYQALGGIAKRYRYDESGELTEEETFDLIHTEPTKQEFYENGDLVRAVYNTYFDDRLYLQAITELAPLSEASRRNHEQTPQSAAVIPSPAAQPEQRPSEQPEQSTETPAPIMPAEALTPEPTEPPTPAPTPEPTQEPTEPPTPTPDATTVPTPDEDESFLYGTITNVKKRGTVRIGPSENSERIGAIAKDAIVIVLDIGEEYTKIRYSGGVAYVHTKLFTFSAKGKIVNVNNRATVRSQPDSESDRLGAIDKGKSVTVLEFDGTWMKIEYNGGIGYVFGEYVQVDVTMDLLD